MAPGEREMLRARFEPMNRSLALRYGVVLATDPAAVDGDCRHDQAAGPFLGDVFSLEFAGLIGEAAAELASLNSSADRNASLRPELLQFGPMKQVQSFLVRRAVS